VGVSTAHTKDLQQAVISLEAYELQCMLTSHKSLHTVQW